MLLDTYLLLLAVKYAFVFAAPPSVWHFSALVNFVSLLSANRWYLFHVQYIHSPQVRHYFSLISQGRGLKRPCTYKLCAFLFVGTTGASWRYDKVKSKGDHSHIIYRTPLAMTPPDFGTKLEVIVVGRNSYRPVYGIVMCIDLCAYCHR